MSWVSPTLCLAQFLIDQPSFWVYKMVFHSLVVAIYRYQPFSLSMGRLFLIFRLFLSTRFFLAPFVLRKGLIAIQKGCDRKNSLFWRPEIVARSDRSGPGSTGFGPWISDRDVIWITFLCPWIGRDFHLQVAKSLLRRQHHHCQQQTDWWQNWLATEKHEIHKDIDNIWSKNME